MRCASTGSAPSARAAAVVRAVAASTSRLGLPPPAALTGDWFGSCAVIAPTVTDRTHRPRRCVRGSPGRRRAGGRRRLDRLPVVPGRRRSRPHPRGRRRLDGLRPALRPRRPLVVRKPFRHTDAGLASGRRHRAGAAPARGASTGPHPTVTRTAPGCWPAWRRSPPARCIRPACARSSPERQRGSPLDFFADAVARTAPARAAYLAGDWGAVASLSPELFLRRRGDARDVEPDQGHAAAGMPTRRRCAPRSRTSPRTS